MIARFLLFAAAPFLLADAPPPSVRSWVFEDSLAAGQTLKVELVRARVKVARRPGPARVEVRQRGAPALGAVSFRTERRGSVVHVVDVYPGPKSSDEECEPPIGPRGPYWRSMVQLDVEISVPPGVATDVRVLEPLAD